MRRKEEILGNTEKFWLYSDLYVSGGENLALLEIIAIVSIFF